VEAALRESEDLNRAILESVLNLVVVVDRTGRIIATNDAWRQPYDSLGARPSVGIEMGNNYLEVCSRAMTSGDRSVGEIVSGIESVLSGNRPQFRSEYLFSQPEISQTNKYPIPFRSCSECIWPT
jgi:hypothetical protein